jgi:choline dehydrogenase-like flavoprotein
LAESGDHVTEFHCANYADPSLRHIFSGKVFVLAMGGIENARMLLNSCSQIPQGIGNERDLVGRYFMEHPSLLAGYYVGDLETWPFRDEVFIAPTPEFMAERKIANAGLRVGEITGPGPSLISRAKHRLICSQDVVQEFVNTFHDVHCRQPVYIGGYVRILSEQAPNENSRVTLMQETDRFGLRRAAVDWRLTDLDRRTMVEILTTFAGYLAAHGYGNVKLVDWVFDEELPVPGVGKDEWYGAAYHHMGTTRMAGTPAGGVVDENCRIFGASNLFVAGSSVFATGGQANPTFSIVQMTLRLGEHIEQGLLV